MFHLFIRSSAFLSKKLEICICKTMRTLAKICLCSIQQRMFRVYGTDSLSQRNMSIIDSIMTIETPNNADDSNEPKGHRRDYDQRSSR